MSSPFLGPRAREAEGRGDSLSASRHYRRILVADPAHAEALSRLAEIAPPAPAAAEPPSGETVADDTQAALQEADVLARYGLKDRAIEHLLALFGGAPPDGPLDGIELGDPAQGFGSDRRAGRLVQIIELSPRVRPTGGQEDIATRGQLLEPGIVARQSG